jgi:hypothetical protein
MAIVDSRDRFPLDSFDNGNAAAQALHYRTLLDGPLPTHFIWGCQDEVFTESWGSNMGHADESIF